MPPQRIALKYIAAQNKFTRELFAVKGEPAVTHAGLWLDAREALEDFKDAASKLHSSVLAYSELHLREILFLSSPLAITHNDNFIRWFNIAINQPKHNLALLEKYRPKGSIVTENPDREAGWREWLRSFATYEARLQNFLKSLGPSEYTYNTFKVVNHIRLSEDKLAEVHNAIDFMIALFKRRGVTDILSQSIRTIIINADTHRGGSYSSGNNTISISIMYGGSGKLWSNWIQEVLIHEVGHHLHWNMLTNEARLFWNQAWDPIKELKNVLKYIPQADLHKYYKILEKDNFDPSKTAKKLSPVDKIKFAYWLRNPFIGEPLITPNQFRLTSRGKSVFQVLQYPEKYVEETRGYSPHDPKFAETLQKVVSQKKNDVLGLNYSGGIGISKDTLEKLESNPEIEKAVNDILNAMGIPSDYGRSDENEDLAETFVLFMVSPEKLSSNALYRMKRALWLSGFGGKPVMRLSRSRRHNP